MALPDWLLDILACPERNDLRLRLVQGEALERLNNRIEQGKVQNRGGRKVTRRLEQALLREDGKVLYPIWDSIPRLLVDEGIELQPGEVEAP